MLWFIFAFASLFSLLKENRSWGVSFHNLKESSSWVKAHLSPNLAFNTYKNANKFMQRGVYCACLWSYFNPLFLREQKEGLISSLFFEYAMNFKYGQPTGVNKIAINRDSERCSLSGKNYYFLYSTQGYFTYYPG